MPHIWHVDANGHDPTHWRKSLYHFASSYSGSPYGNRRPGVRARPTHPAVRFHGGSALPVDSSRVIFRGKCAACAVAARPARSSPRAPADAAPPNQFSDSSACRILRPEVGEALLIHPDPTRTRATKVPCLQPHRGKHRGQIPCGPVIRHWEVVAIGIRDGMVRYYAKSRSMLAAG